MIEDTTEPAFLTRRQRADKARAVTRAIRTAERRQDATSQTPLYDVSTGFLPMTHQTA